MKPMTTVLLMAAVGCSPVPVRQMAADGAPESMTGEHPRRDDPLQELRQLQRKAMEGDGRSSLLWLGRVSEPQATLSQRMLARTVIEGLLERSRLRDLAAEVRQQLALSWRLQEPISAERARRVAAGQPSGILASAVAEPGQDGFWLEERATVWAGGHDRLYLTTGVLAFLVDEGGEPVFRGTHVWVRNLDIRTAYVSCGPASVYNRALRPGEALLAPIDLRVVGAGTFTTGVDVTVRAWRRPVYGP